MRTCTDKLRGLASPKSNRIRPELRSDHESFHPLRIHLVLPVHPSLRSVLSLLCPVLEMSRTVSPSFPIPPRYPVLRPGCFDLDLRPHHFIFSCELR